jgi:hypothetical protein
MGWEYLLEKVSDIVLMLSPQRNHFTQLALRVGEGVSLKTRDLW